MIYSRGKNSINVLVVSKSSWVSNSAFGNTLSNLFGNSHNLKLYNVYLREQIPDNDICTDFYNITDLQLVKNMITPWKIGNVISSNDIEIKRNEKHRNDSAEVEAKIIRLSKKHLFFFIRMIQEFLWFFGGWRNKKFSNYLVDRNIDIIFAPAAEPIYLQHVVNYCRKVTDAKLVLFFADDTYTYKTKSPLKLIYQTLIRRSLRNTITVSSKLYGASKKLCEEYMVYFGKDIHPLYKGCSFEDKDMKKTYSFPIKIIYAGNLYYGRDKILAKLADEIVNINEDNEKINLEIYTSTSISYEMKNKLNRGNSSKIMGSLPYSDIKKVLKNANIVLHVESFDPGQVKITRLSFSTKIIDCMQSGSCMMAIGPDSIASIDYLLRIDGVITITDPLKIGDELEKIVNDPYSMKLKTEQLSKFARSNHDIKMVRNKLAQDLFELSGKNMNSK